MTRDRIIIGLSTALGLSIIGNGIVLTDSGQRTPVQLVEGRELLTGGAATPLKAAMDRAGALEPIQCTLGGAANYPDRHYCQGGTAGFLLPPRVASDLVAEVEAKFPGMVSDAIEVGEDADGNTAVRLVGVQEAP